LVESKNKFEIVIILWTFHKIEIGSTYFLQYFILVDLFVLQMKKILGYANILETKLKAYIFTKCLIKNQINFTMELFRIREAFGNKKGQIL
jgi:hypothetical protein